MRSPAGPTTVLRRCSRATTRRRALLLERLEPGTPLWSVEDDEQATEIGAGVLQALHRAPPPRASVSLARGAGRALGGDDPGRLARDRRGRIPASLVELAVDACRTLPGTDAGSVVLHQDFHGGNVLYSGARGWLAIDPKPLVGDPAFDAASLLRDRRWLLGGSGDRRRIERRLDLLVETTGLDRERMRLWGIVHALAWGVSETTVEEDMVRCAELLAAA